MKVKKINFNEYIKQFEYISGVIDPALLFKVDKINKHNKFNIYFSIPYKAVCYCNLVTFNTIELKGLISSGGGAGTALLQYIIKNYNVKYNIILDSFESNNKFYIKNGFKPYKKSAYNKKYDPDGLNKNKESVIYYKIESGGGYNE